MNPNQALVDSDLEALLQMHFLNEFSEEEDLAVAQSVFAKKYAVQIDEKKEKQLLKKLYEGTKGGIHWGMIWALIAASALVVAALLLLLPLESKEGNQQEVPSQNTPELPVEKPVSTPNPKRDDSAKTEVKIPTEVHWVPPNDTLITRSPDSVLEAILEQSQPVDEATGKTLPSAMNSEGDQPAAQPVLFSKAELAYYSNLKKGVIENLISYHDELYTEVEGGIVNYKKRRLNVDRFIIRNISVTNMEYKVFLVDLFTNRNTKALEVALVNNEGWIYHQCNQLGDQYFQGHQYDGFPVVNISADAMALYCEWLDKEVNAYLIATKSKSKPLKIRLPYTYEWIHAAYTGAARMADCAGHYTIFSLSEGYVNKAFVNRVEKLRKKDRSEATRWDTLASINRYGMGESEILQLFQSVAPTISNDTPFQEYPTGLLKIGKAAHVSELNQEEDGDRTVVVGCWSSKEEYWGMLREFNALSASPFVGFRFVIDDGRRQTYVQPLWR